MTTENISWSISKKECCRTQWGLNLQPHDHQSDAHLTEFQRPATESLANIECINREQMPWNCVNVQGELNMLQDTVCGLNDRLKIYIESYVLHHDKICLNFKPAEFKSTNEWQFSYFSSRLGQHCIQIVIADIINEYNKRITGHDLLTWVNKFWCSNNAVVSLTITTLLENSADNKLIFFLVLRK